MKRAEIKCGAGGFWWRTRCLQATIDDRKGEGLGTESWDLSDDIEVEVVKGGDEHGGNEGQLRQGTQGGLAAA